ncbi:hypothetical protein GGS21DRAFT_120578 [Xylaria nigripes]|nr:hypothetical protein GGS21DRAFT_120578 [Xylaria nigripes]
MKLSASASSARSALFLFGIVSTGLADECSSVGNAQFHFIYGTPNLSVLCPSPISRLTCTLIDLSNGLMESHDHLPDTINVSIDGNSKNCEVTGPKTTIFSCTCKTLSFIAQDRLVDLRRHEREKRGRREDERRRREREGSGRGRGK